MGESRESINHAWKFDEGGWSEPRPGPLRAHTVFAEDRVWLPAPTKDSSQPPLTPVASTSSRSHVLMPTHTETRS